MVYKLACSKLYSKGLLTHACPLSTFGRSVKTWSFLLVWFFRFPNTFADTVNMALYFRIFFNNVNILSRPSESQSTPIEGATVNRQFKIKWNERSILVQNDAIQDFLNRSLLQTFWFTIGGQCVKGPISILTGASYTEHWSWMHLIPPNKLRKDWLLQEVECIGQTAWNWLCWNRDVCETICQGI